MDFRKEISEPLIRGEVQTVTEAVRQACHQGENPNVILEQGLMSGMMVVGQRFKKNEMFIPEVLASAKAMNEGLTILKPLLVGIGSKPVGKVVIGTVKGDLHDLGKNIVGMMLEANRLEVIDLGVDVPIEKFVEAVQQEKPDIMGMSALLSTTMPRFGETIQAVRKAKLNVKIIIGGAQVNSAYAEECGADGYAPNAIEAVDLVKKLIEFEGREVKK
jgi:5-methyltetrahydrofolate--homocysteine methyltransferase